MTAGKDLDDLLVSYVSALCPTSESKHVFKAVGQNIVLVILVYSYQVSGNIILVSYWHVQVHMYEVYSNTNNTYPA